MRVSLRVTLWASVALSAWATSLGAQLTDLTMRELVGSWAGPTPPACADSPGAAELPAPLRVQDCTWAAKVDDLRKSRVTGSRTERFGTFSLSWALEVADTIYAATVADSVGTALRARGLREYQCPWSGRRWQAAGMAVQYTRGAVNRNDGLLSLLFFATTMPEAMPAFACPDAPALPSAPALPPRRDATR